jgi:hypothetical protein
LLRNNIHYYIKFDKFWNNGALIQLFQKLESTSTVMMNVLSRTLDEKIRADLSPLLEEIKIIRAVQFMIDQIYPELISRLHDSIARYNNKLTAKE